MISDSTDLLSSALLQLQAILEIEDVISRMNQRGFGQVNTSILQPRVNFNHIKTVILS